MITGNNHIGSKRSGSGSSFQVANPATGDLLPGDFKSASFEEIEQAVTKASAAFETYRQCSGKQKAAFLRGIADEILELGSVLVDRAVLESGLPEGRIIGERGRTMGQLNMFADLLEEGSWVEATVDTAIPDRAPVPKPDIRKMLVPVGPVVVFGASNFPLAFSTAGGDTASALASGCPVVVKAHPSHAGTSELVSSAIIAAAAKTGMPDGVFSHLFDPGFEVGVNLVKNPKVKSVAFTGSLQGGKALFDLASSREEPIPVFAEMGSINPVIVLPGALRNESLAAQYAGSITLGSGQFCTNPGLLIGLQSEEFQSFKAKLGEEISKIAPATMLNSGIEANYERKRKEVVSQQGVHTLSGDNDVAPNSPLVAEVGGQEFLKNPRLHEEVFGPFSLIVEVNTPEELEQILEKIEGQLTATVMGDDQDLETFRSPIEQLKNKVGRIIFNGVPTGVEVCTSMQHGGPYPATTDSRFTSVGTGAIRRFVRPLSYQNWPQAQLPEELQDGNPLGIMRIVDGNYTTD